MEDEQVKKLAETLKEQGLAASMYEAMEKARRIIGVGQQKEPKREESPVQEAGAKPTEQSNDSEEDILKSDVTVNELMQEIGVTEQQVEEQEKQNIEEIKEKVEDLKEGIKEARQNPEKTAEIKEEMANVKEEIDEVAEERGQEQQETSQAESEEEKDDRFKEEKKIDLTKVFGSNK